MVSAAGGRSGGCCTTVVSAATAARTKESGCGVDTMVILFVGLTTIMTSLLLSVVFRRFYGIKRRNAVRCTMVTTGSANKTILFCCLLWMGCGVKVLYVLLFCCRNDVFVLPVVWQSGWSAVMAKKQNARNDFWMVFGTEEKQKSVRNGSIERKRSGFAMRLSVVLLLLC